ncbi:unnamed protein product [Pleuronectes platessa]|uniref:Uncharacterized protein n=1 Tax=Pleuronectes platessa TaxID=8262 RepID=A0A9N7U3E8_PLEPL|nr:unnamed protein product [Pleuronectes platessa]
MKLDAEVTSDLQSPPGVLHLSKAPQSIRARRGPCRTGAPLADPLVLHDTETKKQKSCSQGPNIKLRGRSQHKEAERRRRGGVLGAIRVQQHWSGVGLRGAFPVERQLGASQCF